MKIDSAKLTPAEENAALAQRLAKARDAITRRMVKPEKAIKKARFEVGKIVLDHPEIFTLIAAQLEPHLFLLGPTRAVVDEYADNIARLDHLKSLQRR